tara:strand:+ start:370 stop:894 length:525 start_codon:yes stop_codon:yes gene_type:complete
LGRAVDFYKSLGYIYVEVPWYVDPRFVQFTYTGTHRFKTGLGDLVGSAEQSLLSMSSSSGVLTPGTKYVACSPCFRDNMPDDALHSPTFMKVELYIPGEGTLEDLMYDAMEFFISEGVDPKVYHTHEGQDLVVAGIEVGSYGTREVNGIRWTYGTGVAEPRFSQAKIEQELSGK